MSTFLGFNDSPKFTINSPYASHATFVTPLHVVTWVPGSRLKWPMVDWNYTIRCLVSNFKSFERTRSIVNILALFSGETWCKQRSCDRIYQLLPVP